MARWPPPVYRIRAELDAPLPFVLRWCTDYRPDDARRAGERYARRILVRQRRRIVFEDLWWEADGWRWRRYDVRIRPPDRWRADTVGNVRDGRIDYRLARIGPERTRLTLSMRRRPGVRSRRQPSRRELEGELTQLWANLGRALAAEYRRTRRRRPVRRR